MLVFNLKFNIKIKPRDIIEEIEIIINTKKGNIPTSPPGNPEKPK